LWGAPGEICLSVRDSGTGFDSEAVKESRGIGLISMEERLAIVNGNLYIDSHPNIGTTIYARVPINAERDWLQATG
jgi:signal transduction histidine kinase